MHVFIAAKSTHRLNGIGMWITHKAVIVFYNDTAADITVPDTLTDGEGVEYTVTQVINTTFSRNTATETITFPAAVTNIDRYVFNSCSSLKAVYIDDENTKYYDDDGVLYYKNSSDEDVLMYYPVAKNDPIIYVKDGTEIIGQDAIIATHSGAIVSQAPPRWNTTRIMS